MNHSHNAFLVLLVGCLAGAVAPAAIAQKVTEHTLPPPRLRPNLETNVDQPLRYHPDGADFVIENGTECFNRALYGGNTAFRVDAGDKPEFVLYLPGRGGNLRLGVRKDSGSKWLHSAQSITSRYRPGGMIYEIRDPLLGANGSVRLEAYALKATEGLVVRVEGCDLPPGLELLWAYGGVNGQRGARDGDIGTERVPISEYFQLKPEFCAGNTFETAPGRFTLTSKPATMVGCVSGQSDTKPEIADANQWNDPGELFASATPASVPKHPVVIGRVSLRAGEARYLAVQRLAAGAHPRDAKVTAKLLPPFKPDALPGVFSDAEGYFKQLRERVVIDTPDPFLNASVGALNVAADAVWDDNEEFLMHGAIAWRAKYLGWRGPYALDALGWHDRARSNINFWIRGQNTKSIPATLPPADEKFNLSRSETAINSNGDMQHTHYDMNLVFIDVLFRHLLWTGDRELAVKVWPALERHLAWEQRLFRRPYGPEKLPLYEAYAAIWASDDLYYNGGGTTHASAYNVYHNKMAARVARWIGKDPVPYEREADLILRAMREYLWLPEQGYYAEYRDLLGKQLLHPGAAIWTVYHTIDSEAASPEEAWKLTRYLDQMPHIPVRGAGVPPDPDAGQYALLPTTTWMPYSWSINNVCMNENAHAALSYWQAGRSREGNLLLKSLLLASMYMGIAPGNVGTMTYLDAYRRESQRDFADASGMLSRAIVEGLFGVHPDGLAGELRLSPGFPAAWDHASFRHPDLAYSWKRAGQADVFTVESHFARPMSLRLTWPVQADELAGVTVNGVAAKWEQDKEAIGKPRLVITAPASAKWEIGIQWKGKPVTEPPLDAIVAAPAVVSAPGMDWSKPASPAAIFEMVDVSKLFNKRVTEIFTQEYRSPRSPYASLAIPKQGIGAWAGHVHATAEINDSGLRKLSAKNGGRVVMPNGVPFSTPGAADAPNIIFTSLWDNYPKEITVPLGGRAKRVCLLMAGSTSFMQSRFDNGEVVVAYSDGTTARLALNNPVNWWPIEQDYFIDDYQFQRPGVIPPRVDLKTGKVRLLDPVAFKGCGRVVEGGAATVLDLALDPSKELKSLSVRPLANEVIIGLMSVTLAR